jgi:hypothetical protein
LIKELLNSEHQPAVTSDHWHVVLAQWTGASGEPTFLRSIVSEHDDSASALRAARDLKFSLTPGMASRPKRARDQVMVRKPSAESAKTAGRVSRRRS